MLAGTKDIMSPLSKTWEEHVPPHKLGPCLGARTGVACVSGYDQSA